MAVDTALRRASCLSVAQPFLRATPPPSGTIAQNERQFIAFCYPGIAAGEVEEEIVVVLQLGSTRRGLRRRR